MQDDPGNIGRGSDRPAGRWDRYCDLAGAAHSAARQLGTGWTDFAIADPTDKTMVTTA